MTCCFLMRQFVMHDKINIRHIETTRETVTRHHHEPRGSLNGTFLWFLRRFRCARLFNRRWKCSQCARTLFDGQCRRIFEHSERRVDDVGVVAILSVPNHFQLLQHVTQFRHDVDRVGEHQNFLKFELFESGEQIDGFVGGVRNHVLMCQLRREWSW